MNALAWIAVVLIAIWLAAVVFFKVVGFTIHLALIAAVLMLIAWAFGKISGHGGGRPV